MANISKKLVFGVGVKGGGVAAVNGKPTKAYATWTSMLQRCYYPKCLSRQPTYIGCSVYSDWLFFPTFNAWFDENYVEGWHLDKDLLVTGNKIYSHDTCIFVPPPINTLFNDNGRARGEYPIGVSLRKRTGKFQAQLNIDGKVKHLGYFNTVEDAHRTYLIVKKENVIRMVNEWQEKIPVRLYEALIRKANDLI